MLRGAGEDKTVLATGSFSAGARALPTPESAAAAAAAAAAADAVTAVQHCLMDPSTVGAAQAELVLTHGSKGVWLRAVNRIIIIIKKKKKKTDVLIY